MVLAHTTGSVAVWTSSTRPSVRNVSGANSMAGSKFVLVAASFHIISSGNLGLCESILGSSERMVAARHSKTRFS